MIVEFVLNFILDAGTTFRFNICPNICFLVFVKILISALNITSIYLGNFFGCQIGVDVMVDDKTLSNFLHSDAIITNKEYSVSSGSFLST